jgi:hypothetical protein
LHANNLVFSLKILSALLEPGMALMLALLWIWTPFVAVRVSWAETPLEEKARVRGQKSSPLTTGPVITDTTIPQAPGTATLFIPTFLGFTGGKFSPDWRRAGAGGDFTSLSTQAQLFYGVAPRTEVYMVVPYLHNWAGNVNRSRPTRQKDADFGGLGDINLTAKYLLLDEQGKFPAVSGIFSTTFPTGHYRRLNPGNLGTDQLGQGAFAFTPGINFYKYVHPFLLYGNLWYSMFTDATVAGVTKYYRDQVTVNLAAEYPLRQPFVFLIEFDSTYDAGRLIGPRSNQPPKITMSLLPALECIVSKDWSFVAGVLIDLSGKNTRYNYTPNFSMFFNF